MFQAQVPYLRLLLPPAVAAPCCCRCWQSSRQTCSCTLKCCLLRYLPFHRRHARWRQLDSAWWHSASPGDSRWQRWRKYRGLQGRWRRWHRKRRTAERRVALRTLPDLYNGAGESATLLNARLLLVPLHSCAVHLSWELCGPAVCGCPPSQFSHAHAFSLYATSPHVALARHPKGVEKAEVSLRYARPAHHCPYRLPPLPPPICLRLLLFHASLLFERLETPRRCSGSTCVGASVQ